MPRRVDVVVVTFNSADYLSRLAESIRRSPTVASVTVVDNGSSDPSVALARRSDWGAPARVIDHGRNIGFGRAMNIAASADGSDQPYILVINPDVLLPDGSLQNLVETLDADAQAAVVGAQLVTSAGEAVSSARRFPSIRSIALRKYEDVAHEGRTTDADWVCGALMLWRRSAFEEVGGFSDEFFLYYEDVDICAKARQAGYGVKIVGSTTAIHDQGHGKRPSKKLARANRVSRRRYASKWLGARGWTAAIFADAGEQAARIYHRLRAPE
jgi:GT2 family glycosyltransferase